MITVVSGLPRSGTSLMMQMLLEGGMPVLRDAWRPADEHNPRGYLEYQKVRSLKDDRSWLHDADGRAIKVVSQLLYYLPDDFEYRVIFMRRDLDEVLQSQEKMLAGLNRAAGPDRNLMKLHFTRHLQELEKWLSLQSNIRLLDCSYHELIRTPSVAARSVSEFLNVGLDPALVDPALMVRAVDPTLCRQRSGR